MRIYGFITTCIYMLDFLVKNNESSELCWKTIAFPKFGMNASKNIDINYILKQEKDIEKWQP